MRARASGQVSPLSELVSGKRRQKVSVLPRLYRGCPHLASNAPPQVQTEPVLSLDKVAIMLQTIITLTYYFHPQYCKMLIVCRWLESSDKSVWGWRWQRRDKIVTCGIWSIGSVSQCQGCSSAQCDRCRSAPDYSDHSDPEITNTRTLKPVTCNPLETHTGHSLRVAVNLDTKTWPELQTII